jgi:hypothetical protein
MNNLFPLDIVLEELFEPVSLTGPMVSDAISLLKKYSLIILSMIIKYCITVSNITAAAVTDPNTTIDLKIQFMNECKKELTNVLNTNCLGVNSVFITDCDNGHNATDLKNGVFDPVVKTSSEGKTVAINNKSSADTNSAKTQTLVKG